MRLWKYLPGIAWNNVLNFALILQIVIVPETLLLKMGSAEVPLPVAVPSSPEIPAVNGGSSAAESSRKRTYAVRALIQRG